MWTQQQQQTRIAFMIDLGILEHSDVLSNRKGVGGAWISGAENVD
jgi:hypothetical protein